MLSAVDKIKEASHIVGNLMYEHKLNKVYNFFPVNTLEDTFIKLATIANNEFLYTYKMHYRMPKKRIARGEITFKESATILLEFYEIYNTEDGRKIIEDGMKVSPYFGLNPSSLFYWILSGWPRRAA